MRWKIFALMIACASLMVGLAFAQGTDVPGDSNGDKIVSAEELAAAEKLVQEGKLSAEDLMNFWAKRATIEEYWPTVSV